MENQPQPIAVAEPTSSPAPEPSAAPSPGGAIASDGSANGPMPAELKHWNWGAFFLTWIWGIAHNVWIALLALVPFLNLIVAIVLGLKGNEWAWQHRRFESVDQFKRVQKIWMYWGLAFFISGLLLMIFIWTIVFSLLVGSSTSDVTNYDAAGFNSVYTVPQSVESSNVIQTN